MINVVQQVSSISREDRGQRNSHQSFVIWFTGISGSGKSTLAYSLERRLYELGFQVYVLDGDNIRLGLSSDLGFDDSDRGENVRRVGEVSKIMVDAGVITLVSLISPYRHDRSLVKKLFSSGNFIEVYCNAKLSSCEDRDVKGHYKKARSGYINKYTGIDSPYEEPENPDLEIETDRLSVDESIERILYFLSQKKMI